MEPRNFLFIGGTTGIGLEAVKLLAAAGHHIVVASRQARNLEGMATVQHVVFDVLTNDPTTLPLPEMLHGLVYCPGSINLRGFGQIKDKDLHDEFELNVVGAARCLRAALQPIKRSGNASVVLFSTVAVGLGMPFHTSVAAAKGALEGMMRAMAAEWAPAIRVNCIAPSLTDTPLAGRLLDTDAKRESGARRHPLGRVGTASDIARAVDYLLSDHAGWVTGQTLHVDGGMSRLRP